MTVARRTACVSFLRARPIKKKKRKNPPYFFFADSFALHDGLISGGFAPAILRFRVRPGRPPDVGATVPVRKTEVKSLMRFRILSIVSSLCNKPIASCCSGAAGGLSPVLVRRVSGADLRSAGKGTVHYAGHYTPFHKMLSRKSHAKLCKLWKFTAKFFAEKGRKPWFFICYK